MDINAQIKAALERICGLHDEKNGELWKAISDAKALLLTLKPMSIYTKTEVEWRQIADFPDYEVSNYGVVRRLVASANNRYPAGTVCNPRITNAGYAKWVSNSENQIHRRFHGTDSTNMLRNSVTKLMSEGLSEMQIAEQLGTNRSSVNRVINNVSHIGEPTCQI